MRRRPPQERFSGRVLIVHHLPSGVADMMGDQPPYTRPVTPRHPKTARSARGSEWIPAGGNQIAESTVRRWPWHAGEFLSYRASGAVNICPPDIKNPDLHGRFSRHVVAYDQVKPAPVSPAAVLRCCMAALPLRSGSSVR